MLPHLLPGGCRQAFFLMCYNEYTMFDLSRNELRILKKLSTPAKIQDFLNAMPINHEPHGDTCRSPRMALRKNTAHCMEGAMLAALTLRLQGHEPLVMDIQSTDRDMDHVVALFRIRGKWGAISKTNHAVLRYREPVYATYRELALSYFHEYFMDNGRKTMRTYSVPLNLAKFDKRGWMTDEKDVFYIPEYLDGIKHYPILDRRTLSALRKADAIEIAAGKIVEWDKKGKRLFKESKKR
jgi:hypothetical protein